MTHIPTPADYAKQAEVLQSVLHVTPVQTWDTPLKQKLLGREIKPVFKLELFQKTGSFKARGALTVMQNLAAEEKARGVVAGSGGNHGIAVAYAAKEAGVSAKIIVPKKINPFRLAKIRELGADVQFVEEVGMILDTMNEVAISENRAVMHPFENPLITLGAGTLGYEFVNQVGDDLDIVIVPIGGGGLASGVASAVKQLRPECKVFGVEPAGANSMYLSFQKGEALPLPSAPVSIADSLCAPRAEPYSFSVCKKYIDEVVLINDSDMKNAMRVLMEDLKLISEPAGAAATAALLGPLKERCVGKKVGVIVCGSNIDLKTFSELIAE